MKKQSYADRLIAELTSRSYALIDAEKENKNQKINLDMKVDELLAIINFAKPISIKNQKEKGAIISELWEIEEAVLKKLPSTSARERLHKEIGNLIRSIKE
jgi:hypothetical protein